MTSRRDEVGVLRVLVDEVGDEGTLRVDGHALAPDVVERALHEDRAVPGTPAGLGDHGVRKQEDAVVIGPLVGWYSVKPTTRPSSSSS